MSDQILDNSGSGAASARPTFLTVLCILTFIGSAWGLIGVFIGDMGTIAPLWYKLAIAGVNVATGYGAWQMWNLKKQGLMIYTVGEVLVIIFPLILVYAILPSNWASLMGSIVLLMAIFPVAFIIMYWANAKYLN